jgi:hypothetical protein
MNLNEFADKIEKAALTVSRILGSLWVTSPRSRQRQQSRCGSV